MASEWLSKAAPTKSNEDPVEPEATSAVVIEKQVGEFYSGGKVRRYNMAFYVKFAKDDGSEVIFDVPQEKYAEIYVGQKGILVTAGEQFIDFGE